MVHREGLGWTYPLESSLLLYHFDKFVSLQQKGQDKSRKIDSFSKGRLMILNGDMDLLSLSRSRCPPNASPVTFPSELIAEVLSFLPVKSLMQLRSVCKSWKSIIDDPIYVKVCVWLC